MGSISVDQKNRIMIDFPDDIQMNELQTMVKLFTDDLWEKYKNNLHPKTQPITDSKAYLFHKEVKELDAMLRKKVKVDGEPIDKKKAAEMLTDFVENTLFKDQNVKTNINENMFDGFVALFKCEALRPIVPYFPPDPYNQNDIGGW